MKVETLARTFTYSGIELTDPGATMDAEAVKGFYTMVYPELVNAVVEGPVTKGKKLVFTFKRSVGTKG